jgi:drug/metabolite transporter (DMT)-like permease
LEPVVFVAVLFAAFLHAAWNVLVKINLDRFLALFLIHVLMGVVGLALLAWTGLPIAACWPYAIASGSLHTGYNLLLARSYRHGEMSVVYPVARGAAPIVSLVLSVAVAGDRIAIAELMALGVLIAGLWLVALGKAQRAATDGTTLIFAFATAVFIGCYTVVDGMGARVAGDALAYSGLIFALDGLFLLGAGLAWRGLTIVRQVIPFFWRGLAGSIFSSLAYGIVIWAMTKAPIATVAGLRETSILFVLVMAVGVLKEKLTAIRILGGVLIVAGAAALRFV